MYVLPEYVNKILNIIEGAGYEAYVVGGAVRDMLAGKIPIDWDIASSAPPEKVKELFDRTVDTGIKHGTVTVIIDGNGAEVTVFRKESSYSDTRRPDHVEFITELQEDLKRRDFTINAMAYSPRRGFTDNFNGKCHLDEKIIQCVGNPDERFQEDALRMMRAVRFAAVLEFDMERKTHEAILNNVHLIRKISAERIREELFKILLNRNIVRGFELLSTTGLLKELLPELEECRGFTQKNPYHSYDVFHHTLHAVQRIKPQLYLRLCMLLHDLGKVKTRTYDAKGTAHFYHHGIVSKEIAKGILERFKIDEKTKAVVLKLIEYHDYFPRPTEKSVRKAISKIGKELFADYLEVREADDSGKNPLKSGVLEEKRLELYKIYKKILHENSPTSLNDLAVNGRDLIEHGLTEGKRLGETLNYLLEQVLDEPALNKRDILLKLAREYQETVS